jgi:hypothetical protein
MTLKEALVKEVAVVAYCRTAIAKAQRGALSENAPGDYDTGAVERHIRGDDPVPLAADLLAIHAPRHTPCLLSRVIMSVRGNRVRVLVRRHISNVGVSTASNCPQQLVRPRIPRPCGGPVRAFREQGFDGR